MLHRSQSVRRCCTAMPWARLNRCVSCARNLQHHREASGGKLQKCQAGSWSNRGGGGRDHTRSGLHNEVYMTEARCQSRTLALGLAGMPGRGQQNHTQPGYHRLEHPALEARLDPCFGVDRQAWHLTVTTAALEARC